MKKFKVNSIIINAETGKPFEQDSTAIEVKKIFDDFGSEAATAGYEIGKRNGMLIGTILGTGITIAVINGISLVKKHIKKSKKDKAKM